MLHVDITLDTPCAMTGMRSTVVAKTINCVRGDIVGMLALPTSHRHRPWWWWTNPDFPLLHLTYGIFERRVCEASSSASISSLPAIDSLSNTTVTCGYIQHGCQHRRHHDTCVQAGFSSECPRSDINHHHPILAVRLNARFHVDSCGLISSRVH